ncbi:reverse transcriptase domain-containing protein [Tanacetum coccineum]|uniref:Reverse transcriptase domain-containing protein n=1 Tax=Tanacetum coccineum TaxID=301880 RepID=A0ABQ5HE79_9ASTR
MRKTEVLVSSSSHSSDLAAKFLNFSDIPTTEAEIVSPLDVPVHHEVPSKQTPTLLTVPVSVITDSSPFDESLNSFSSKGLPPQSSYEADATLTEFELKKILIDKIDKIKCNSLKRSRKDKDKDKDPSAGSDQRLKKRKTVKDPESSKSFPKAKESQSGSSKGDKSQPKSSGKSAQSEEPDFEVGDSDIPQDQEENMGNDNEEPKEKNYTTSLRKTKAAQYDLQGIEDMVPNIWVPVKVEVTRKHGYGYLKEIVVRRADNVLYRFKEGDFPLLRVNNIEDMILLVVQNRLTNLSGHDVFDFAITLRMFTKSLVIHKRVEDLQLEVENPQGFIYVDNNERNRLMQSVKLYKFSDRTLTGLRTSLDDITKNIRMEYLPKRRWSTLEKEGANITIKAIDKQLKERRLMRSLEKFIGGRHYGTDLRWLSLGIHSHDPIPRDIPLDSVEVLSFDTSAVNLVKKILLKLNLPDHRLILMDSKMEVKYKTTYPGDAFSLALITEARLDDQATLVAGTMTKTFGNNGGDESESSGPVTPMENKEAIESWDTSILNSLFGHESPRSLQLLGTLGMGKWLKIVGFNLEGAAAEWFQWMTRNGLITTWAKFKESVRNCFGPSEYEDPNGALSKLLQLGKVKDYQWEFEKLMNRATDIPDSLLISFYISGLKLHLQREFLVSRPTILGDAFSLALITEARLDDQATPVAGTMTKTFGNNGGGESESSGPVTPMENKEAIESGDTSILNSLFGHESPRSL